MNIVNLILRKILVLHSYNNGAPQPQIKSNQKNYILSYFCMQCIHTVEFFAKTKRMGGKKKRDTFNPFR